VVPASISTTSAKRADSLSGSFTVFIFHQPMIRLYRDGDRIFPDRLQPRRLSAAACRAPKGNSGRAGVQGIGGERSAKMHDDLS
jgi:hypothetical protein